MLEPGTTLSGPVSPATMSTRIARAAFTYERYSPVPRIALYDIAYPANATEFAELDGYAIMLVSVISQDAGELPPKRVYVKGGLAAVVLTLVSSVLSPSVEDPIVGKVFGQNRWDGLYLLPISLVSEAQELLLDFAKNREGFVVAKFSNMNREPLSTLPRTPPTGARPSEDALVRIVGREYRGFIAK